MYVYPIKPTELYHYGMPERSGRYAWGSGDRPYQRLEGKISKGFKEAKSLLTESPVNRVIRLDNERMNQTQISKGLDKFKDVIKTYGYIVSLGASNVQIVTGKNEHGEYVQFIKHSAKGSEWENHKYVKKIDGVYYYPVGYEDGRTIDSIESDKDLKDSKSIEDQIKEVKQNFDQYLAKRGIDWRTLPKEEVDQMQRDIAKQLESGKETGASEKSTDELVKDVISGKLGSGEDRKKLLGDRYSEVQKKVNEIVKGPAGSKKVSEVTEESVKTAEETAKKVSASTSDSKVHSGVDMDKVMGVYKKK